MRRRLCWRLWRGRHRLDLVEENAEGLPVRFVGLVDGALATSSPDRREAGVALVRRSTGRAAMPSGPSR